MDIQITHFSTSNFVFYRALEQKLTQKIGNNKYKLSLHRARKVGTTEKRGFCK